MLSPLEKLAKSTFSMLYSLWFCFVITFFVAASAAMVPYKKRWNVKLQSLPPGEVLTKLDLDRPGLESVKAAAEKGDQARALAELLRYYRDKFSPSPAEVQVKAFSSPAFSSPSVLTVARGRTTTVRRRSSDLAAVRASSARRASSASTIPCSARRSIRLAKRRWRTTKPALRRRRWRRNPRSGG